MKYVLQGKGLIVVELNAHGFGPIFPQGVANVKGKQEGSWHIVVVWVGWVTMGGWPIRLGFNLAMV